MKFSLRRHRRVATALLVLGALFGTAAQAGAGGEVDRRVLPATAPAFAGKIGQTYKDSTPDWQPVAPLQAPKGAPNVLLIMLDDVGYGQLGAYGSSIRTPNIDRLATQGVRFTDFHTTALCSPTRAATLTGRNHHSVGMAAITEAATGFPGSSAKIPRSAATIAEVLKLNGYNTMAYGKWHLAPYTAYTQAGPFDQWPLGMGFERFYGFLGGETDQWAPLLVQDNKQLPMVYPKGYHLTADLADQAIGAIRDQQQTHNGRPFFVYFAPGAAHAPLHVPKAYIDRYRGQFDQGWDHERDVVFARQKRLGLFPADAVLPPRNAGISPWDELDPKQKKLYARLQETFAGFLTHTDEQIGRLLASLDEMGIRDNTLVILMSDNGASQEGLRDGATNTDRYRNFLPESVDEMLAKYDQIGGPETDPHYPMGWAMAGNTPFKRWKQDTHNGGNSDPLIVSWPARIKDGGTLRRQYTHAVDISQTLLEVAGLPIPEVVNGVQQQPMEGVSFAYALSDAEAPRRKQVQYYEMLGSRAIWADGWKAVTWHQARSGDWKDDHWELYHTDVDPTESHDLAQAQPDKLKQLQELWQAEAKAKQVLPLDDRRYERTQDPTRPAAALPSQRYVLYPGTSVLHPLAGPQITRRSYRINAELDVGERQPEGVLVCLGGEFGGWSLFIKDGQLRYEHNMLQIERYKVSAPLQLAPGKHQLSLQFTSTGPDQANPPTYFGGDVTLLVDGQPVAERKGVRVAVNGYSVVTGYGWQVGRNEGTAVSHDYAVPFRMGGELKRIEVEMLK